MKQVDVTDAWLYKYMPIVDEAIINEIEKNVDYNYDFSDEFNRKMEKTIRKEKFIPFWKSLSKVGKRVAIFALIIISSLFTVTMSVKAYRIQFFEAVKTIWEDSFFYTYFTEENDVGFQKRELGYLPDDYSLMEEISNDNISTLIYSNGRGEQIIIDQHLVSNNRQITLDLEYTHEKEVEVKELPLLIYRYEDGFVSAYYEYQESAFILSADKLSDDEIIKIMEGIE